MDLKRVSELAHWGLFSGSIQLVFTDKDIGEDFQHLGLLSESKEMHMCEGARTSYSFLHLSIQEFLAALYASHCHELICKAPFEIFEKYMTLSRVYLDAFGQFLSGFIRCSIILYSKCWRWHRILRTCLRDANTSEIKTLAILCQCYGNYFLQCLFETQDSDNFQSLEDTPIICEISVYVDNPIDAHILGYCLVHIPILCSVVIKSAAEYEVLISSLKCHANRSCGQILGCLFIHVDTNVYPDELTISKFQDLLSFLRSKRTG